jgi:hypothetical protein
MLKIDLVNLRTNLRHLRSVPGSVGQLSAESLAEACA